MPKIHHLLRESKRSVYPRYVIYYDTETDLIQKTDKETVQQFRFGYAEFVDYKGQSKPDSILFTDLLSFWKWVSSKAVPNNKLYLIAHNQDFDFRVCEGFTYLHSLGWYIHKLIIDYPRFICNFANYPKKKPAEAGTKQKPMDTPRKSITALDSLNWFRESLFQLGEQLGIKKLTMPEPSAPQSEWDTYCKQDVRILRAAVEKYTEFLERESMGNFGVTLAAQSMNAFKHRFMKHEIHIHNKADAIELEREGYYGGRTECFRIGEFKGERFYKVDINSMYPYVMRNNPYPAKLLGYRRYVEKDLWNHHYKNSLVLARVIVNTKVPCVPYRMGDKLIFPTGQFTTTLCTPELRLLEKEGQHFEVVRFSVYEPQPIFEEFVSTLYKLRLQFKAAGNDQYQYFTKILMNSLYGKFGQRNATWIPKGDDGTKDTRVDVVTDADTQKTQNIKVINGEWFVEGEMEEGFDSFVAISAFVTSYARAMLWDGIKLAGKDNVYYMDTDSLFVNETGLANMQHVLDDKELGKWANEDSTEEMIIHNLKDYVFGSDIKIKGVSKKAVRLSPNVYQVEQWEHFNGAIMRNRMETVVVKKALKTLRREYLKGLVSPEGIVTPFELNDSSHLSM